jgi:hypothetical protein
MNQLCTTLSNSLQVFMDKPMYSSKFLSVNSDVQNVSGLPDSPKSEALTFSPYFSWKRRSSIKSVARQWSGFDPAILSSLTLKPRSRVLIVSEFFILSPTGGSVGSTTKEGRVTQQES